MIETITIKNVATFENNGVQINDLKKVNFFFGFNGTGKSTIAKYLQNLSFANELQSKDFLACSQSGYNSANEQILTFNNEFTEEHFIKSSTLRGVFSLNQKNEIIDKQIEDENNLIKTLDNNIKTEQNRKQSIINNKTQEQRNLNDYCWQQRDTFKTFFKIQLEHAKGKENLNHLNKIRNVLQNNPNENITIERLTETYKLLYEKELKHIDNSINILFYKEIRKVENELQPLLQEVIIGNEDVDIAELINQLDIRNWVEIGTTLIEKTDGKCPFCQNNTITENLKEQFNKYFDETYKKKIQFLENLLSQYKNKTTQFLNSLSEIQTEINEDNMVSNVYQNIQSFVLNNIEAINYKIKKSNEKKSIVSILTIKENLSEIIKTVKSNNLNFENLKTNRDTLISEIWQYMALQCKPGISKFDKRKVKYERIDHLAQSIIDSYDFKIQEVKIKIETLRNQTVNTKEAVDNINAILRNTGFEGFEIEEIGNNENNISQYRLKRHNNENEKSVFKNLSEGEKNFISFLYFYQLCVGTDDIQNNSTKKKIIVIDDPVSSLDSQSLFVVAALIHNLILRKNNNHKDFDNINIEQFFIFTHNFYFYKEISLKQRHFCKDYWHFRITKTNNVTLIAGEKDKQILDDYALLWQSIKDIKNNLPQNNSQNILISNSMRRIIDSYVSFVGGGDKDVWFALKNENHNEPHYFIKHAFASMINKESHEVIPTNTIYYQNIIKEQPQVLFDVFEEIFSKIGKEHYEIMMND